LDFLSEKDAKAFVTHGMNLTSMEKAHIVKERLRQIEADEAFAAANRSMEARAAQQSSSLGFEGATALLADINTVQNIREWTADEFRRVFIDVADGVGSNISRTDVVINFIDDRDNEHNKKSFSFSLPNSYQMIRDFHLKDNVNHVEMSSSFDAESKTEMGNN